jgi:hypothetical protein
MVSSRMPHGVTSQKTAFLRQGWLNFSFGFCSTSSQESSEGVSHTSKTQDVIMCCVMGWRGVWANGAVMPGRELPQICK